VCVGGVLGDTAYHIPKTIIKKRGILHLTHIMEIKLPPNQIAVLFHDNELVACLNSNYNARACMELAVSEHFCCDCTLVDDVDYDHQSDIESSYTFRLYNGDCPEEDEYIKLTLSRTGIY
jgi:hypothetical protein